MKTMILALDLGTTHTKGGLFNKDGTLVKVVSRAVATHHHPSGYAFFDPQETWAAVVEIIKEVTGEIRRSEIAAVGITSMAETGLLVDNQGRDPRTSLIPWFDTAATPHVETLKYTAEPVERFRRSGIRPTFKSSLAKLLWIRHENPDLLPGTTWLTIADFIAFRLSGWMATDYSLAGRTYAFRIDCNTWDREWLEDLGIQVDQFPQAVPSGQQIGVLTVEAGAQTGLLPGTPIAICGHDHVCAALAISGIDPGKVFDSMGTAEALVGCFPRKNLGESEYKSGLVFGRHVAGGGYYWMGGMSASGGSLEWMRSIFGDPPLSYLDVESVLDMAPPGPSGIVYFPYLSGSGSPHTDVYIRGAFIGLTLNNTHADLIKAVLEGTAFEAELIRQAAQNVLGNEITSISASGGGTRLQRWMQIKADISGCKIEVPDIHEAALLGAALVAGIGMGLYSDVTGAIAALQRFPTKIYMPDDSQHHAYHSIYQGRFLPLQTPLRHLSRKSFIN